jgi:hypothetical protein
MAGGGWPYLKASGQASFEATALSLLATTDANACERARSCLLQSQNANGSWPAFEGDDDQGSWVTGLALVALRNAGNAIESRLRAARWLLSTFGREAHWLWKWKFRFFDRHVAFDPQFYGWPWTPDTNSWVVPTAFAMLGLESLPCECGLPDYSRRMSLGASMLLDRSCPSGGWNSGNSSVYGSPLAPHIDDTAVALLALHRREPDHPKVVAGVDWLERNSRAVCPSASLALSVIALSLYQRPKQSLLDLLESVEPSIVENSATLALLLIALDAARGTNAFGETL